MKRILIIVLAFCGLLSVNSCQKNPYIDTGVFKNDYSGTITDYLHTRPELFDTLTKIIDLTNLQAEIDKSERTFFAPPNRSIMEAIRKLNSKLFSTGKDTVKNVIQVPREIWSEFLGIYLFDGVWMANDIPQLDENDLNRFSGQDFLSFNNKNMRLGVVREDIHGGGQSIKYAGYRRLKIGSLDYLNNNGQIVYSVVATSDIKTSNGVLHVIRFDWHEFGFHADHFVNRAYNAIINQAPVVNN